MPRKSLDGRAGVWHPSNAHTQIPFSGWNKQATDFAGTCSTVRGRTKKQGWRWMCTSAREAGPPPAKQSPSYVRGVGGVSCMKIPDLFRYPGRGSVLLPSRDCMSSGNKKRCQKWHQGKRASLFLPFYLFSTIKKVPFLAPVKKLSFVHNILPTFYFLHKFNISKIEFLKKNVIIQ